MPFQPIKMRDKLKGRLEKVFSHLQNFFRSTLLLTTYFFFFFKVQLFIWFLELISQYCFIRMYWRFQTGSLCQFLRKTNVTCIYCLAAYAEQIIFELKLQFTISLKFHITLEAVLSKFWFTLWSSTVWMRKAVPLVPSRLHPMAEMLRPGECLVWQKWVRVGKVSDTLK